MKGNAANAQKRQQIGLRYHRAARGDTVANFKKLRTRTGGVFASTDTHLAPLALSMRVERGTRLFCSFPVGEERGVGCSRMAFPQVFFSAPAVVVFLLYYLSSSGVAVLYERKGERGRRGGDTCSATSMPLRSLPQCHQ
jgi:hypothetical protein